MEGSLLRKGGVLSIWLAAFLLLSSVSIAGTEKAYEQFGDLYIGGRVDSPEVKKYVDSITNALERHSPNLANQVVIIYAIGDLVYGESAKEEFLPTDPDGLRQLLQSREIEPVDCYIDRVEMTDGQVVFWVATNLGLTGVEVGKLCAGNAVALALSMDIVGLNALSSDELRGVIYQRLR
ncbi:hypothetical protein [Ruegeria hyattellae]|uniref:hypothetical protein n=1 Tax=Ruegeria hyattellae TaxID=3233337 RepID=UPI00355C5A68